MSGACAGCDGYADFARYYDRLNSDMDYRALGEYFHGLNVKHGGITGGIALDLACGTGSLSVELKRLGYDVIGTDASEEMLNIAAEKPHEGIQYLCQDMTELDMFGTVDFTVCSLDGINHLSDFEAVKRVFSRVSLFSMTGATFIFDVNTLYKHREILAENTFVYDLDNLYCVWQNDCPDGKTVYIDLDFFEKNGESSQCAEYTRSSDSFAEIAYPLSDIEKALTECGFKVVGIYDYLTENKASENSEKAVFVAKKL